MFEKPAVGYLLSSGFVTGPVLVFGRMLFVALWFMSLELKNFEDEVVGGIAD